MLYHFSKEYCPELTTSEKINRSDKIAEEGNITEWKSLNLNGRK